MEIPSESFRKKGEELIRAGRVAALVVAGGQGTRLKLSGSKGLFPISPIKQKTLFQIFAERTLKCGEWAGRDLSLVIMTSPANDAEVRSYFEAHQNFGLSSLCFFTQDTLPFKHLDGSLVYQNGKLLEGPDGNGGALRKLVESGVLDLLKKSGVEIVTFTVIDNPLVDPFDANLVGMLVEKNLEAALIAIEREGDEKVGLILEGDQRVKVVEYTESEGIDSQYANISAFAFRVDFIERVAKEELPLHSHQKEIRTTPPIAAFKFEKFIFDNLDFAKRSGALLYPREEVFAPLKNASGKDSPEEVKKAILLKNKGIYERISGLEGPSHPFELDFSFYYPQEELLKTWKGRPLSKDDVYIEGSQ